MKLGGSSNLSQKSLARPGHLDVGTKHLDRYGAVMAKVTSEKDDGHTPATELVLDFISLRQLDAQPPEDFVHTPPRGTHTIEESASAHQNEHRLFRRGGMQPADRFDPPLTARGFR